LVFPEAVVKTAPSVDIKKNKGEKIL
jgi:hypothetical protein